MLRKMGTLMLSLSILLLMTCGCSKTDEEDAKASSSIQAGGTSVSQASVASTTGTSKTSVGEIGESATTGDSKQSDMSTASPSKSTEKTNFELLGDKAPVNTLLLIVNNPDDNKLKHIKVSEKLNIGESSENMVLIPKNVGSKITIEKVSLDGDKFKAELVEYKNEDTPKNFALHVNVVRPEGVPSHRIIVEYKQHKAEYIIAYDGKDGTPDLEYIK